MLSTLDYATISQDVYGDKFILDTLKTASLKSKNIQNKIYRMLDADPSMHINKPFYAQLYINFRHGEAVDAVAAYRGTVVTSYTDLDVDTKSWYKSVLDGNQSIDSLPANHFTDFAARFYRTCRDYLAKHFPSVRPNRLHVTGHSLGGALAALMPTTCGFPTVAVTFNAPGIGTIPGVNRGVGGRIFGIEARYDFISKVGQHIEKPYLVHVPNKENIAKEAFALNDEVTELQHDIRQTHDEFITPFKVLYDGEKIKTDLEVMTEDFFYSAYAQHKIDNLVNALKEPTYSALANQLIV